jgi:hypothetical protein
MAWCVIPHRSLLIGMASGNSLLHNLKHIPDPSIENRAVSEHQRSRRRFPILDCFLAYHAVPRHRVSWLLFRRKAMNTSLPSHK